MTKFLIKFLCLLIPAKNLRTKFKNCFAAPRKPLCRHIGRHTYLGANVAVSNRNMSIGSFCSIAGNAAIGPSQHPLNFLSTHPFQYLKYEKLIPKRKITFVSSQPVTVGNDVWIGANVIIMDGLKIRRRRGYRRQCGCYPRCSALCDCRRHSGQNNPLSF